MARLVCKEFIAGVKDSLRGFLTIRNLNDDVLNSVDITKQTSEGVPGRLPPPRTILEERRRKDQAASLSNKGATSGDATLATPTVKPRAQQRLLQCVGLNIVFFALSKITMDFLLVPAANYLFYYAILLLSVMIYGRGSEAVLWNNENVNLSWICQCITHFLVNALWILPLFVITRVVNAIWFQDISNAVGRSNLRSSQPSAKGGPANVASQIADFVLAIFLDFCFLLQAYAVSYIPLPFVAQLFSFAHLCLLYSLYAFEYAWMSNGVDLKQRLFRIESYWPYHLGFGALLALITMIASANSHFVLSGCAFGALFPFFIVSSFTSKHLHSTGREPSLQHSEIPQLKIFFPSIALCNRITLLCFRGKYRSFASRL